MPPQNRRRHFIMTQEKGAGKMTDKTIQYPIRVKHYRQPHRGNAVTDTSFITDENDLLEYAYAFLGGDKSEMDCGRVADERSSINSAISENAEDGSFIANEESKLAELDTGGDDHPFYIYTGGAGEGYRYDFFRTALQLLRAAAAHDHQFAEIEILGEGDAAFNSDDSEEPATEDYAVRISCETPTDNWVCLQEIDESFDSAQQIAEKYNKSREIGEGLYDESLGVAEVIKMSDISQINFAAVEGESGLISENNRLHFTADMFINSDGNLYSTEHLEDEQTTGDDRNALELIKSAAEVTEE